MKHPLIHQWLEQIYATQDAEIDCQQFQAALPAFVDYEISGGEMTEAVEVNLRAHLAQCANCAEEYAGLKVVAELEAQGQLPEAEALLAQFEAETNPQRS